MISGRPRRARGRSAPAPVTPAFDEVGIGDRRASGFRSPSLQKILAEDQ
jgi:hypothetical protein